MGETCKTCFFMSFTTRRRIMPDWCKKHGEPKRTDDPACKEYVAKED